MHMPKTGGTTVGYSNRKIRAQRAEQRKNKVGPHTLYNTPVVAEIDVRSSTTGVDVPNPAVVHVALLVAGVEGY